MNSDAGGLGGAGHSQPDTTPRAAGLIFLAVTAGLALRLAAARGELWIDEIWSLTLVAELARPFDVFWQISHDNNHFLNSLWLAAIGPDAPVLLYRAPAILLGALSSIAAAAIFWRSSRPAAVAAAWLVAIGLPLVQHGSEARGYSGLILCTLVAIAAWMRSVEGEASKGGARWMLAAATGIGMFFHLTMIAVPAVLGLASLIEARRRRAPARAELDNIFHLYLPSGLALLPVAAALVAGVRTTGEFAVGGVDAFALPEFLAGYGGALGGVVGIEGTPGLAVALVILAAGLVLGLVRPPLRSLAIVGVLVLPALMLALRLPNTAFPRYYLIPSLVLTLMLADILSALVAKAGGWRIAAAALTLAIGLGQGLAVAGFLHSGRGAREAVVRLLLAQQEPAYGSNSPFRAPMIVEFYRRGATLPRFVRESDFCTMPPRWYLAELPPGAKTFPAHFSAGPAVCRLNFERLEPAPAGENRDWAVYRRL